MELRHIRTFLVLAEELHFGRTATRMHVVQSGVSQTIKALEQEVGAQLFRRSKRQVELTSAGQGFLAHARRALVELDQAAALARSTAHGETGVLRLRFTTASALTVVPRVIVRFKRDHPGVHLDIRPGKSTDNLEAVERRQADIAFVSLAMAKATALASAPIERAPLMAVVGSRHPFAGRARVSFAEVGTEPLVLLGSDGEPDIRARLRERFAGKGIEPNVILEVEHMETLLAFVAAGLGISVAPSFVLRLRHSGVRWVPLTPSTWGGFSAVWDAATLSPVGARFLERLRQEARSRAAESVP